jgi:hypothetical protein
MGPVSPQWQHMSRPVLWLAVAGDLVLVELLPLPFTATRVVQLPLS